MPSGGISIGSIACGYSLPLMCKRYAGYFHCNQPMPPAKAIIRKHITVKTPAIACLEQSALTYHPIPREKKQADNTHMQINQNITNTFVD
ncbi:MAG: hypothetical protein GY928_33325 [Colwellia sp.]|nr:hypothetical protein [Colwellia sp.]